MWINWLFYCCSLKGSWMCELISQMSAGDQLSMLTLLASTQTCCFWLLFIPLLRLPSSMILLFAASILFFSLYIKFACHLVCRWGKWWINTTMLLKRLSFCRKNGHTFTFHELLELYNFALEWINVFHFSKEKLTRTKTEKYSISL